MCEFVFVNNFCQPAGTESRRSIACDGKFLYVTNFCGRGLAKIGTGLLGTLRSVNNIVQDQLLRNIHFQYSNIPYCLFMIKMLLKSKRCASIG